MLTCFASIYFPLEKFPLSSKLDIKWALFNFESAQTAGKERVKMEAPSKTLTFFSIVLVNFLLLCRAIPFHCEYLIFYSANFFHILPQCSQ